MNISKDILIQIWVPLIIYLFLVLYIGFYSNRITKQKEGGFLSEYFLGNRNFGGFVVAMTLVATYTSASSFLGGPGTAYNQGLGWVLLAMTQLPAAYVTLGILGKRFAIISRKVKAVTLIDVIRERYDNNPAVVWLSSLGAVIFLIVAVVAQFVGGAKLFQTITGLPYIWGLILFGGVVLVYVTYGGFRAVVLTDAVQGTVMFFGTIILLLMVFSKGGGVYNVMQTLYKINPELITPFGVKKFISVPWISSFWVLVCIGILGLPQNALRAMAYKNSKAMHYAMIIGTVVVGVLMLGLHLVGAASKAILPEIPKGLSSDTVIPLVAIKLLPRWVAGILLAAPLAAIMSTVDSQMILISSTIVKDLYLNYINPKATQKQIVNLSILSTALIGLIILLLSIKPPALIIWINLYAFGGLEATFFWLIILGLYWKRANAEGAIASMITGVASFIIISKYWPRPFGMHPIVITLFLGFVAFYTVSLLTKPPKENTIKKFWSV
ncbi:sodium/pantothenate symporter [Thermovenabulum gondwanense]|uniref:Sodium/pantothenate symporter n=1 Tax=Thermovenabulum gondwanense TaxID=520767 RepID=A0A161PS94_9FIRM|nr:sodium/pantothenate symporter [Thermovenabulum gondwanense]KYO63791.1 Sodium/pantothenate symporter [Thermovenabulum gondwanense]